MRIRFWALVLFALIGFSPAIRAQEQSPQFEAYAGYDYVRFNVHFQVNGDFSKETYNANGGGGQIEFNVNRWLGLVGDFTGLVVTQGEPVAGTFSYLFGPRVNFLRGKITPFTHALFGGMVATGGINQSGLVNHLALAAGGGLDIKVSKLISIRPVQAEYLMTRFPDGINNRQDNFRFSAGVVFCFSAS
jgi:hypothetical protein